MIADLLFFTLGFPDSSVGLKKKKNVPAMQETLVQFWVRKICWRRDKLPIPIFMGFPCGSDGKESACNTGDFGSIPGLGRSPGEGKDYPLQCSGLEKSRDYTVHGVTKSRTWLSDLHFFWLFVYWGDLNSSHYCITWLLLTLSFIDINSLIKLCL